MRRRAASDLLSRMPERRQRASRPDFARIRAAAPTPAGAMAAALMVGDRGAHPRGRHDRRSGMPASRICCRSPGLHMGLMAGIAFFAVRALLALNERLALRYPIKKFAAVAGIVCAALYLVVTGAPIPTQRSFIMAGHRVCRDPAGPDGALHAARRSSRRDHSAVLRRRACLMSAFQMSFAAVIALIALYDAFKHRLASWRAGFTTPVGRAASISRASP